MLEKGLKEVAGQLVYDRPWHCSLCRRRYKRRHMFTLWDDAWDRRRGEREWRRYTVRLCVGDNIVAGCFEMGLQHLFRYIRRRKGA